MKIERSREEHKKLLKEKRKVEHDDNNLELLNMLKERKFFILKKYYSASEEWVININYKRMELSPHQKDVVSLVFKRTKFLKKEAEFWERLVCVFHNLKKIPKCTYCGKEVNLVKPLWLGYNETCGNKSCVVAFGTDNRGGLSYNHGLKKPWASINMKKVQRAYADSILGKSREEILGKERALELNRRQSKIMSEKLKEGNIGGHYSKHRKHLYNPNTEKDILIMSSYEDDFFNFILGENIWIDSCYASLKYWNTLKSDFRWYNPDFVIKYKGNYFMIEVKPKIFLSGKHEYDMVNIDKLKRLNELCKERGRICLIITEDELNDKNLILNYLNSGKSNYSLYIKE